MKSGCVAEKQIARAGDEQRGRHAVKIGNNRREDGIATIGVASVFLSNGLVRILRLQDAGKAA